MRNNPAGHASDWAEGFRAVHDRACARYQTGERKPDALFNADDSDFMRAVGCSAQELFDFIDDGHRYGEPGFESVLLITAVRRDFFLRVQNGVPSGRIVSMETLPAKDAELGGIPWLPRIIAKARAKLKGEMPPDLMYGCGGDRRFLREVNIHPADFLRVVWEAGDDEGQILDFVNRVRT